MFLQSLILTHTPFLSWRAQLPACALALAPSIRPPLSDMEAREVEITQISGNVWPQLVLFALGTFFVVSITQVPHSTSLARGSMASVTTKRKKGSQLVPIERCCKTISDPYLVADTANAHLIMIIITNSVRYDVRVLSCVSCQNLLHICILSRRTFQICLNLS